VTPTPLQALAAALDREDPAPEPGDPMPSCWHWLHFLPLNRQSEIGPDGSSGVMHGPLIATLLLERRFHGAESEALK
jgi:hydroxyacyl-ACP dehydratase HTD2-like protein with hotdog domain